MTTYIPVAMAPVAIAVVDDLRIEVRRGCVDRQRDVALGRIGAVCRLASRPAQVIRIDAVWLGVDPLELLGRPSRPVKPFRPSEGYGLKLNWIASRRRSLFAIANSPS